MSSRPTAHKHQQCGTTPDRTLRNPLSPRASKGASSMVYTTMTCTINESPPPCWPFHPASPPSLAGPSSSSICAPYKYLSLLSLHKTKQNSKQRNAASPPTKRLLAHTICSLSTPALKAASACAGSRRSRNIHKRRTPTRTVNHPCTFPCVFGPQDAPKTPPKSPNFVASITHPARRDTKTAKTTKTSTECHVQSHSLPW